MSPAKRFISIGQSIKFPKMYFESEIKIQINLNFTADAKGQNKKYGRNLGKERLLTEFVDGSMISGQCLFTVHNINFRMNSWKEFAI